MGSGNSGIKKLYVSLSPYTFQRSRESGEADLEEIAKTAKHEFCWVFEPEKTIWRNPGGIQKTIPIENSPDYRLKIIPYPIEIKKPKSASIYHIHPSILEESLRMQLSAKGRTIDSQYENCIIFYNIRPSKEDVFSFAEMHNAHSSIHLDFRIASEHGTLSAKFHRHIEPEIAMELYRRVSECRESPQSVISAGQDRNYAIQKGLEHLNSELGNIFTMSFRPREN